MYSSLTAASIALVPVHLTAYVDMETAWEYLTASMYLGMFANTACCWRVVRLTGRLQSWFVLLHC
jgi:hypothetical protein